MGFFKFRDFMHTLFNPQCEVNFTLYSVRAGQFATVCISSHHWRKDSIIQHIQFIREIDLVSQRAIFIYLERSLGLHKMQILLLQFGAIIP